MTETENVIKGLGWILNDIEENGHYHVSYYADEIRDAIALLKEQEPKLVRYTASTVRCPNCNKQITTKGCIHREIKYCWKCGQAVKWYG